MRQIFNQSNIVTTKEDDGRILMYTIWEQQIREENETIQLIRAQEKQDISFNALLNKDIHDFLTQQFNCDEVLTQTHCKLKNMIEKTTGKVYQNKYGNSEPTWIPM